MTTIDNVGQAIQELRAEEKRLHERGRRRRDAAERDNKRLDEIRQRLLRFELMKLVNEPDAVKIRYRYAQGDRCSYLNDLAGTLTEVRRTRGTVKFNGESWNIPLSGLVPANEQQGWQGWQVPR